MKASDRLTAAKAAKAAIEKEIEATTEALRRALLEDDDDHVAAAVDDELTALRRAAQRYARRIELLPQVIADAERDAEWPNTVPALKSAIAEKAARLCALETVHRFDHSAASQAERDHLRMRVPALRQRLELLSKMETS
jgi:hypothetical protein